MTSGANRPGFGARHPDLATLLARHKPAATGESYVDTAVREVHEETGWLLDRDSLQPLGWLHLEHLAPRRPHDPYPYPDLLQVVFCATATDRDGGPNSSWTDTDGYERISRLVTLDEARATTSTDLLAPIYLDLLPA